MFLVTGVDLHDVSEFAAEDEVVLIDGLYLQVKKVDFEFSNIRDSFATRVDPGRPKSYHEIFECE